MRQLKSTMKQIYIYFAILAVVFFTACGDDEAPDPFLRVSPLSIQVSSEPPNQTFTVESNIAWTATSEADWISIVSGTGSGEGEIQIAIEENPENIDREGLIIVTDETTFLVQQLTVTQLGNGLILEVPNQIINISDPLSVELEVTSNLDWSFSGFDDWLTISPESGNGNETVTITATANTTGALRESEFQLASADGKASLSLVVRQE